MVMGSLLVCSTVPRYWVQNATAASGRNKWSIHLQGGAWCQTDPTGCVDCDRCVCVGKAVRRPCPGRAPPVCYSRVLAVSLADSLWQQLRAAGVLARAGRLLIAGSGYFVR